jgi:hypothetical protein
MCRDVLSSSLWHVVAHSAGIGIQHKVSFYFSCPFGIESMTTII